MPDGFHTKPLPARIGYYDRAIQGDPNLDIPRERARWRPIRDAAEALRMQIEEAVRDAIRTDPQTAGWDMPDMLATVKSAEYDANHALAELDKADRVDLSERPGADLAWYEGRV